jgi:hypothetical protein
MNTGDENSCPSQQRQDRREHPRAKVRVPVELCPEANEVSIGAGNA